MVVSPGLSQPLDAVGRRITSWNDDGDGLAVGVRSVVRSGRPPALCLRQLPSARVLSTPTRRHPLLRPSGIARR